MKAKRPYLASECDSVQMCEMYRQQVVLVRCQRRLSLPNSCYQVIRDISKSVTAIQNAGLGEFRIRDLNDHINKLLREKKHWENRLRELGGKSYSSKGAKMLDRYLICVLSQVMCIFCKLGKARRYLGIGVTSTLEQREIFQE